MSKIKIKNSYKWLKIESKQKEINKKSIKNKIYE